jgi:hypothetical protein
MILCVIVSLEDDQLQKNVEAQVVAVSAVGGPATSDWNAARLFMAALVDHLCSLYETNPNRRERLFQSMFIFILRPCCKM